MLSGHSDQSVTTAGKVGRRLRRDSRNERRWRASAVQPQLRQRRRLPHMSSCRSPAIKKYCVYKTFAAVGGSGVESGSYLGRTYPSGSVQMRR